MFERRGQAVTDIPEGEDEEFADEDEDLEPVGRHRAPFIALAVVLVVALGLGLWFAFSRGGATSTSSGPEGVAIQKAPDLASADSTATGQPIDGITCRTSKQQTVKYHIHVYVDIYVDGKPERIPAGAGIPAPRAMEHLTTGLFDDNRVSGCLYWLHVHANDGVVHVESPYKHTFTLGQFFDVWQQPLGPDQVGPAHGTVVVYENGKRFEGNPRDVPLLPHAVIQIDVGSPAVPYKKVSFEVKGLCGAGTLNCTLSG
jgi:hypothetical protein